MTAHQVLTSKIPFMADTVDFFSKGYEDDVSLLFDEREVLIYEGEGANTAAIRHPYFRSQYMQRLQIADVLDELLNTAELQVEAESYVLDTLMDKMDEYQQISIDLECVSYARKCNEIYEKNRREAERLLSLSKFFFENNIRRIPYSRIEIMFSENLHMPEKRLMRDREHDVLSDEALAENGIEDPEWADPDYWIKHWKELASGPRRAKYLYSCKSILEAGFAILDYMAISGIVLRRCNCCNKIFVPVGDGRSRYCSNQCARQHEKSRIAQAKNTEIEKVVNNIRSLGYRRAYISCAPNEQEKREKEYRDSLDYILSIRERKRNGALSDEDALKLLTDYHLKLKNS